MTPEDIQEHISKIGPKPLVITHGPCLDGWTAAFLASLRWAGAEIVEKNYDHPVEIRFIDHKEVKTYLLVFQEKDEDKSFILEGRDVLILDFSFKRSILESIKSHARSLLVLDHHTSAEKDLAGLDYCIFDQTRSGAGLALDAFFPGARRWDKERENLDLSFVDVVLAVEDRDTWKFSCRDTREVCAALEIEKRDVETWKSRCNVPGSYGFFANQGAAMLRYQRHLAERIADKAVEVTWPEGKLLVVNSPVLQSEVGEILYEKAPAPLKAAIVYYHDQDGKIRCSIRSAKDGADVTQIAKRFGGGGHPHASGFSVGWGWQLVQGVSS